ncbi:MAG TPA: hypothetical protein VK327_16295 [Candidatus Paceibacterota bacterium]|nr:hypothetical protein [Candidatus Paceibacterota bacterium]
MPKHSPEPRLTAAIRQEIYRRAGEELKEVDLLKPRFADEGSPALRLAPLILTKHSDSAGSTPESQEARVVWYLSTSQVIRGVEHQQWTYFWQRPRTAERDRSWQGVRITLNSAGDPAIWEVLNDSSGAELIWVVQSLEIAAAKEFGQALPGRVCSVEPAIADAGRVIVPDVVDDGPTPMGPILYTEPNGDVRAVACRCSATQAESLRKQGFYTLQATTAAVAKEKMGSGNRLHKGSAPWFSSGRLESSLRLPKTF